MFIDMKMLFIVGMMVVLELFRLIFIVLFISFVKSFVDDNRFAMRRCFLFKIIFLYLLYLGLFFSVFFDSFFFLLFFGKNIESVV